MFQTSGFLKKIYWYILSKGLYPTIFSSIGFSYIAIPPELEARLRHYVPLAVRKYCLEFASIDKWTITLLIVTILSAVWGGVASHVTIHFVKENYKKLLKKYSDLQSDYEGRSIDCYKLFSNYIYGLYLNLKLGTNERVSLYKLDLEKYSCIGRFSENEIYKGRPNRLYPKHQGCIAKAWEVGSVEDADSPDPESDWAKYVDHHTKKYGYSEEELKVLRMKSRSFFGIRIRNEQKKVMAVLMFESTLPNGLPFGKIKKLLNENEQKKLCSLIEALESHLPSLESANSEGF